MAVLYSLVALATCGFFNLNEQKLNKIERIQFSNYNSHMSSAQQPHIAHGYGMGQCRQRPFWSSQKVLLDSKVLECYYGLPVLRWICSDTLRDTISILIEFFKKVYIFIKYLLLSLKIVIRTFSLQNTMLMGFHLLSYPNISEINPSGLGPFFFQSIARFYLLLYFNVSFLSSRVTLVTKTFS